MPTIAALHRFPVKGLSGEPLAEASLAAGAFFPGDRLFAIENGPAGFDPAAPRHQPKVKFLMLMRHEALARLATRYDDATGTLTIVPPDAPPLEASLDTAEGRTAVAAFFTSYLRDRLRGLPALLSAPPGFRFTDSRRGHVSLLNAASVRALGDLLGRPLDPLRFRANVLVEGWEAWAELALVGARLRVGEAKLEVVKRTERCAAIDVDPATGARDASIPRAMMAAYGHADCGVYAAVLAPGRLRPGDAVERL